jgi:hypothetical protein
MKNENYEREREKNSEYYNSSPWSWKERNPEETAAERVIRKPQKRRKKDEDWGFL